MYGHRENRLSARKRMFLSSEERICSSERNYARRSGRRGVSRPCLHLKMSRTEQGHLYGLSPWIGQKAESLSALKDRLSEREQGLRCEQKAAHC